MNRLSIILALVFVSHVATAGTPTLVAYKGPNASVSFPRGWVIQQENGIYAAQRDPKKKDAAAILFVFSPNTDNATEDQLLDAIASQISTDLKTRERAAIKGGVGHYLIADGTSDGVKVRVAAVAVVANGQTIVSLLAAKPAEFDALGGLGLVVQVLGSLKPDAPASARAPATPPPAPPPTTGGQLVIAPPARALTLADLAGDWTQDDNVVTSYASSSSSSGGYSAAATAAKWRIDPKGIIYTKLTATSSSSSGGTYQINDKSSAALTISADTLTITHKKGDGASPSYVIRGWGATGAVTVLKLNGPYYGAIEGRVHTDPHYATNLDGYWVRTNAKTR